jgi:hypothetical protein
MQYALRRRSNAIGSILFLELRVHVGWADRKTGFNNVDSVRAKE